MSDRAGHEGDSSRPIRGAIDAYLRAQGFDGVSTLAAVTDVWSDVVGAHVAKHVRPASFAEGELIVDVDQPAWATEVAFMSASVLAGLADKLGGPVATAVKARVRGTSGIE